MEETNWIRKGQEKKNQRCRKKMNRSRITVKKKKKNKKLKKRMSVQNEGVTNLEKKMRDGRTLRKGMVREIKNKRD